jgi:hypothetical protein
MSPELSRPPTTQRIEQITTMSVIDDILAKGDETRKQLRALLNRNEYPRNTTNFVLLAYVDIALEHHAAIWLLAKSKLYGSAFAMVRLVFDTMLRSYWIYGVATEEQIQQAWDDELTFPPMAKMRTDIKERYGAKLKGEEMELFNEFFRMIKELWQILSSYTHSGGRQIGRRFREDEVKPSYSEAAIVQALHYATVALLVQPPLFFRSAGFTSEAQEADTLLRNFHALVTKSEH